MINFNNYEEYLIDYLQGELDETVISELEEFMNEHQEIKVEFELLKQTIFTPEPDVIFADKKSLLKPITVPFYITFKKQLAAAAVVSGLALIALYLLNPIEKKEVSEIHVKKETTKDQHIPNRSVPVNAPEAPAEVAKVIMPEKQKSEAAKLNRKEVARVGKFTPAMHSNIAEKQVYTPVAAVEAPRLLQDNNSEQKAEVMAIHENAVIQTPDHVVQEETDAFAVTQTASAKSKLTLNKQRQPKLFKAIGQFVKLTRKVKHTRETIANSGLTVIVGNKKIITLN